MFLDKSSSWNEYNVPPTFRPFFFSQPKQLNLIPRSVNGALTGNRAAILMSSVD